MVFTLSNCLGLNLYAMDFKISLLSSLLFWSGFKPDISCSRFLTRGVSNQMQMLSQLWPTVKQNGWLLARSALCSTENIVVTTELAKHYKQQTSFKFGQGAFVGKQNKKLICLILLDSGIFLLGAASFAELSASFC